MALSANQSFLAQAQRAIAAGLAWAQEHQVLMTFVVIDVSGTVCAAARMDGSRMITYEIALAKANTAREFHALLLLISERGFKPENKIAIGQLASRIAFLGGGLPVMRDGAVVGAIGASGGSEDQDSGGKVAVCLAAFSE